MKRAARVQGILRQFWTDPNVTEIERVIEIETWLDVLAPLTEKEVSNAWCQYNREGPRSARGVLLRPDAGALYQIAMGHRQAAVVIGIQADRERKRLDEERAYARRMAERPSPERAKEIMAEVERVASLKRAGKPEG